ncbi:PTS sugar transporter subunit IIA [Pseudorhodoplanes sp.]|uniref:PTS sugar transporter subunit IIA n=1 Tax=Pseudorhodoplanes sp. TaxID=1934341 RepID=UPI003D0F8C6E
MDISSFLSPDDAILNVRASDKTRLLKDLCTRAATVLKIDAQRITTDIFKREELGSTGIGGGVAIPHARIQDLKEPFGILARLRKPIDFNSIDGEPVDIVFLLLLPATPAGEQLNALAAVARRLRESNSVRDLRRAPDAASFYRAMMF